MSMVNENNEYAENMIAEIEKAKAALKLDKSMIASKGIVIPYEELDEIPHGVFTVMREGVRLETAYLPLPSSERLFVVLAGAITRTQNGIKKIARLPQLNMWSWSKKLHVNYLFIEDPMYYTFHDPQLRQGWYYGTQTTDFRKYTAELICRIAEKESFQHSDIVVYGLSAGGTAALEIGKHISGCSVIANNPQLDFQGYRYNPEFERITGIDLAAVSRPGERNDVLQNIETSDSKFILMINGFSKWDTEPHLKYVSERFHCQFGQGLHSVADNFLVWIYTAQGVMNPHTSTPTPSMMMFLLWVCQQIQLGIPTEYLDEFFAMLNESYSEYYELKRNFLLKDSDIRQQSSLRDSPLIDKYILGRLDIKNEGSAKNNISFTEISDGQAEIIQPEWFCKKGKGYIVNSFKGDITLKLKCIGDGTLNIALKGKLIKDKNGTHLPCYVDFFYLSVDDNIILNRRKAVSHDENIKYSQKVSNGDIVTVRAKWKPHNIAE